MQFLHLFTYDEKFLSTTILLWESVFPKENTYYILGSDKEYKLYERSQIKNKTIFINVLDKNYVKNILNIIDSFKIGFIHYATKRTLEIVKASPIFPWVWCMWGGDYAFYKNVYTIDTMVALYHKPNWYLSIKKIIIENKLYQYFKYRNYINVWKLFKYCAPVVPTEYDILKEDFPKLFKATVYEYSETAWEMQNKISEDSNNILIGNSAFPYNNHLTIFKLLIKKQLETKIIVPLSYGGDKEYISEVEKIGYSSFGENYCSIKDFMSREKYFELLRTCSHAFFASRRQLAMGNIKFLLLIGAKIFLYRENPIYKYLKQKGFNIYSIDNDFQNSDWHKKLTDEEIMNNRSIFFKIFANDSAIKKIQYMVNDIYKHEKFHKTNNIDIIN